MTRPRLRCHLSLLHVRQPWGAVYVFCRLYSITHRKCFLEFALSLVQRSPGPLTTEPQGLISPRASPSHMICLHRCPLKVMSGRARNAFCCVRPPGHHAEPDAAMGFCFFNNAPIGALHAQARETRRFFLPGDGVHSWGYCGREEGRLRGAVDNNAQAFLQLCATFGLGGTRFEKSYVNPRRVCVGRSSLENAKSRSFVCARYLYPQGAQRCSEQVVLTRASLFLYFWRVRTHVPRRLTSGRTRRRARGRSGHRRPSW